MKMDSMIVASQMRVYMIQIMRKRSFWPEHFDPYDGTFIMADNVACYFGCQLACAIMGIPSVEDCWSKQEALNVIRMANKSMPHSAFSDMQRCMHFADD
jgi:hypothetical protein